MERRYDTLLFPGGKSRAFTLSYDDGVVQDRRLAALLRDCGLKCTFNISAGLLGVQEVGTIGGMPELDVSKLSEHELAEVYAGHEIAGHSLYHSALDSLGTPRMTYEILEDKRRLEAISGKPLKTFAYPYGLVSDDVVRTLRLAGYKAARTVVSTHDFGIPQDFLRWNPTCHHEEPELMELAQRFVNDTREFGPLLFYVWGHAYEFAGRDNWDIIERLAEYISAHADSIWFATHGEIADYVAAYRALEYSVDGSMIYNPSALDVTILTRRCPLVLPAGQISCADC